jgi:hypothetical protein
LDIGKGFAVSNTRIAEILMESSDYTPKYRYPITSTVGVFSININVN